MNTGVWTDNWKGLKNMMILGYAVPGLSTIRETGGAVRTYDSYTAACVTSSAFAPVVLPNSSHYIKQGTGIQLGSGSRAPTPEDYWLEAELTGSHLNYVSVTSDGITWDVENGAASRKIRLVVQNKSASENRTIREWCLFKGVYLTPSYNAQSGETFMIYREVLETPVTLQPLESATLALTLRIVLSDPI